MAQLNNKLLRRPHGQPSQRPLPTTNITPTTPQSNGQKQQQATRYLPPPSLQLQAYQDELTLQFTNAQFHPTILTEAAKNHFTPIPPRTPFCAWPHQAQNIFDKRAFAIASADTKATHKLTEALRKRKIFNIREANAKMYHEDLDLRDHWCGLRFLRRGYAPAPYHRCNTEKWHVPMPLRAQAAAEYLANNQWHPPTDPNPVLPANPLAPLNTTYDTSPITLEEVQQSIKRFKNTAQEAQTPLPQNTTNTFPTATSNH